MLLLVGFLISDFVLQFCYKKNRVVLGIFLIVSVF